MSRLLTTLLLYKSGFLVGKYISLESKIADNKDMYYSALAQAQVGWHGGEDNPEPFIKYILGIIIAACRDLEEKMEIVASSHKGIEVMRKAIALVVGKFTKNDLVEICPTLSIKTIEKYLGELVKQGEIIKQGKGRSTYYIKR